MDGTSPLLRRALALTGSLTLALLLFGARPAWAAVTCGFAPPTVTITYGAPDDVATVIVGTGVNLGRILVNGSPCGSATVNNTDTIATTGNTGNEVLVIDLSGGPFAPGATDEAGTTDEIEWDIDLDLGAGFEDEVDIQGTTGNDTIVYGDTGILGGNESINLNGDEDADVGLFGVDFNHADGGLGNDTFSGNGGSGTGPPFPNPLILHGQEGNDDLFGGAGNDFVGQAANLEPGDDRITGGAGFDELAGGDPTASDTLDYLREGGPNGAGVPNPVDLPEPGAGSVFNNDTFGDGDSIKEFENVEGSDAGDQILGNSVANLINGNGGNDAIFGDAGNDTLNGGAGNDTIDGEAGNDAIDGGAGDDASTLCGGQGNDTVLGGDGNDRVFGDDGPTAFGPDGVENGSECEPPRGNQDAPTNGVSGAGGNDVVNGGAGNDLVSGEAGNDEVFGRDGDDDASGGSGIDKVFPGLGTDTASGDAGFDTVDYGDIPGPVEGNLNLGFVSGASSDSISAFEAFNGTPAGDTITGGGGATTSGVVIRGKQGNDTLTGTDGVDLILGGKGDDVLRGLSGGDTQRGNDGNDVVNDAGGDDLVAGGGGNDSLRGGSGDDILRGNGGNDNLKGGSGDDILNGGTGTDTCNDSEGDNSFRSCEL